MIDKTLVELKEGLLKKEFTSLEITKAVYQRIKEVDGKVQSFLALNEDEALKQANLSDEKGYTQDGALLQGLPIGIKDNIVTQGLTTTASSRMLENFKPIYNATVVEKLNQAGAVTIGKLNMDEFAMGGSTETSYFAKTKNPWDLTKVPGGSSGGSAASVAAGMIPASLGSDTGGSIRQPASFTNLVGIKPTYGRVSRYGLIAFASSLDQIGPMTRTVADNALVLQAISGLDEKDATSSALSVPDFSEKLNHGVKGLRIAVPTEYFGDGIQEDIKQALTQAIDIYRQLGAIVEEVSLPHSKYGIPAYYIIASSEASSNLQRFDGIRYGYRSPHIQSLEDVYVNSRSEGFGMEVKRRIMLGTFSLSSGYYDAYFKKAGQIRTLIKQDFESVFNRYDVILGPTTTTIAFGLGEHQDDPIAMYMSDLLTVPMNLAGVPALSMPGGFSKEGLPIGIQLVGNYYDEPTLYQAAQAFETATHYYQKRAQLS
ncbi:MULTISPECIES: Asp-tRNA(Asn)/Glu-tRNA(Gln) amidotransferase subunit GatA [unclassified Granulicatella]|uniref:Asp-tRNA(Asn)/Glu-tRNA(Gln) amidotransferase subunit GatA n=1 Tax=unclassified Granulicatella TaxID=2630493 RepID=UPI0010738860|nr:MULTISPECIES: Asp-tRNA(Asn)/Glu-tRNA(Gln) amidotransferase subunit GatA [unclassified Granulicatella]MBF0780964.1 Asp-tRNA(Asn)/Glu-tRNA(Gln) amidotransferase subunit GatA [Granulicatella sp. 19428wC4_WM01]TFU92962.1 Asp-tRNA(Asn)/Glu-tRNA(Gln) amidotransferase subunit GatA [Granulicatella sp. WM01]